MSSKISSHSGSVSPRGWLTVMRAPILSNTLWACSLLLALNIFISITIYRQLHEAAAPVAYTYLDGDRPIVLLQSPSHKLKSVQMTFAESEAFSLGDSSNESDSIWNTLWTSQPGVGFQHPGPYQYRAISMMHHSLHCLERMDWAFNRPKPRPAAADLHYMHCLNILRQSFLCNADMTLEDGDFMARDYRIDRVGETRTCKDWTQIASWLSEELDEFLHRNGLNRAGLPAGPSQSSEFQSLVLDFYGEFGRICNLMRWRRFF